MKRSIVLGAVVMVGALSMAAAAYQGEGPAPKTIDIQKLRDNLYVLTSSSPADRATFSGGNVSVFITGAGVTLVDTKLAGWGQPMLDRIKSVTSKPVTMKIRYDGPLLAPIAKGQEVAQLIVTTGDTAPQSVPLVAGEDVGKAGFFGRIWIGLKQLI